MVPQRYKKTSQFLRQDTGLLIQKQRKRIKMSQGKLAEAVGLTRTSINNIEHGRHGILLDTLLMISDILKVPIEELIPKPIPYMNNIEEQMPANTSDSLKEWIRLEVIENE